ncbi:molybdopterin-containing oxidoreductase family protein [Massilia putida]|uniref:molybdopterin-containing oxidoreductase family protein n=1 Tax=Massilia putida TaxID=1141883 RepID=UPI001E2FDEF2|nr:molybdopterin-dependent oxidoreductase [Massilia putida]
MTMTTNNDASEDNRAVRSFCRICSGLCGTVVELDDRRRIAAIRGDKSHPLSRGYACFKGLQSGAAHNAPERILRPLKRMPDGSFASIPIEQALDEIAAGLAAIRARDGADALALYRGTQNYLNVAGFTMLYSWMKALGSRAFFSTMTIDQSAKWVAMERLGRWGAGRHHFREAQVWLFAGYNPLLSIQGGSGFFTANPTREMKDAKARGMKIIVIDPRRTETAHYADLFLQPRPGEDPTVAAGLLRCILDAGWHDAAFCADHVDGLDALRAAVEPFTPAYVAARADVPADLLVQAARMFAFECRSGAVSTGTGPDMAARSNLAEHLYQAINVVCGRFLREGDDAGNPGVLGKEKTQRAEVLPPRRTWEHGARGRIRDSAILFGEMMTATLADEILTPGPGQIRSLIVVGGNPASVLPDQRKAVHALRELELLVSIEPFMTTTAALSHYILPPLMQYERPDISPPAFEASYFAVPFAQHTPAAAAAPDGSELTEDWYVFWALARRLGLQLSMAGKALDMDRPPTTEALFDILARSARVPLDQLRATPGGIAPRLPPQRVAPARDRTARFALLPGDVAAELAAVLDDDGTTPDFPFRLCSRRMRDVMNSAFQQLAPMRARTAGNPAWLHPDDLARLGIAPGATVEIVSAHGRLRATAAADDTLRPGMVSMSHGWGGLPDGAGPAWPGANTGLLVSNERDCESINAMPRLSAIPVAIVPCA